MGCVEGRHYLRHVDIPAKEFGMNDTSGKKLVFRLKGAERICSVETLDDFVRVWIVKEP